eukprot:TRINITY_DN4132_c0_g1_i1.p3 TRINITY_DN4132_c0_g1~~TRINITY_DN4132_c0_g1_i1.p3  ORF type:complete len:111 (-),score=7.94 TRINITY_DN4132_c0_g1_i1:324-656(-)
MYLKQNWQGAILEQEWGRTTKKQYSVAIPNRLDKLRGERCEPQVSEFGEQPKDFDTAYHSLRTAGSRSLPTQLWRNNQAAAQMKVVLDNSRVYAPGTGWKTAPTCDSKIF